MIIYINYHSYIIDFYLFFSLNSDIYMPHQKMGLIPMRIHIAV